jgi:hypothetical protein
MLRVAGTSALVLLAILAAGCDSFVNVRAINSTGTPVRFCVGGKAPCVDGIRVLPGMTASCSPPVNLKLTSVLLGPDGGPTFELLLDRGTNQNTVEVTVLAEPIPTVAQSPAESSEDADHVLNVENLSASNVRVLLTSEGGDVISDLSVDPSSDRATRYNEFRALHAYIDNMGYFVRFEDGLSQAITARVSMQPIALPTVDSADDSPACRVVE